MPCLGVPSELPPRPRFPVPVPWPLPLLLLPLLLLLLLLLLLPAPPPRPLVAFDLALLLMLGGCSGVLCEWKAGAALLCLSRSIATRPLSCCCSALRKRELESRNQ